MGVERWADGCGGRVRFVPCRESDFPREVCERAVQWVGEDGRRAEGAEAVFLVLAAGGRPLGLAAWNRLPLFAPLAQALYALVARWRGMFSVLTRWLWGGDLRRPRFTIGPWLFLRALALAFLAAFLSLAVQINGLVGPRGILPAEPFFNALKSAAGEGVPWLHAPSIFWLTGSGETALLGACLLGALAAFAALLGLFQAPMFAAAWILYLSLCVAGQVFLAFQWDGLLLEAGLIAVFLAPWNPRARGPEPVPRAARFMVLWLLFRVMFASGVVKLSSGDPLWWPQLTALAHHFETQPLPTPLAWWVDKLPAEFLKAGVLAMFFIELALPFFLWAPRRLRHAAVFGLLILQAGIAVTGNFGFFNFLTAALCLPALDDRFFSWLPHPPPPPRPLRIP
ncbi:MAG: lipase maturation factor family protein, partial [Terrimicrobiaceae bacterium]|nr:lipase maturation factor family protein [Terrimicrobiaceae bacterium]